ncbi:uncharacterized protein BXZ73DRAFT_104393 [Epithele typhae]|uniref:uncharacterized protein n=1 Tax=Epithele typhae TaxID=378194 RepID=UPI002008B06E|nr:uncharacterized protein BXZ73DRAFT_104393 [Epithele typhae]KAH9921503.1 hypothetical protein BXZ73DRAFT_104393 [Epithele typhae]
MTPLLTLPDDALLVIFSHISGKDAFHMSCCSLQAYELAYPRAFVEVPFTTRPLDVSLIVQTPPRPKHPSRIPPFNRMKALRKLQLERVRKVKRVGRLTELLQSAEFLRDLSLREVEFLLSTDGRFRSTLIGLDNLVHLDLGGVGQQVLSQLRYFQGKNLRTLALQYSSLEAKTSSSPHARKTVADALSALPVLPVLQTLHLTDFQEAEEGPTGQPTNFSSLVPSLPSLRRLVLETDARSSYRFPCSILPSLPHLSTYEYILQDGYYPPESWGSIFEESTPWPSLQELHIPYCIITHPNISVEDKFRVHHLRLIEDVKVTVFHEDFRPDQGERILSILKNFHPAVLSIHASMDRLYTGQAPMTPNPRADTVASFWPELPVAAPRLRSLHFHLHHTDYLSYYTLRPQLPLALSPLHVVHLTIDLPHWDGDRWRDMWSAATLLQMFRRPLYARAGNRHRPRSSVKDRWSKDRQRARFIEDLPRLVVDAVPTLRVFALGDCGPPRREIAMWDRGPPRHEPGWDVDLDAVGLPLPPGGTITGPYATAAESTRRKRWWWIQGEGEGREMVEIWAEDGERARDIVESEGFDAETSLEGFFSEKCRYDP